MESIGDAWGFSSNTPITPSRSFSVETLTGLTPSWKTELNRSISVMEDGIPRGLQHCHETCCEKGGRRGRWACMVQRWHHHGDVVFRTGGLVYDRTLFLPLFFSSIYTSLILPRMLYILLFRWNSLGRLTLLMLLSILVFYVGINLLSGKRTLSSNSSCKVRVF